MSRRKIDTAGPRGEIALAMAIRLATGTDGIVRRVPLARAIYQCMGAAMNENPALSPWWAERSCSLVADNCMAVRGPRRLKRAGKPSLFGEECFIPEGKGVWRAVSAREGLIALDGEDRPLRPVSSGTSADGTVNTVFIIDVEDDGEDGDWLQPELC
jgi:hypothetical protein